MLMPKLAALGVVFLTETEVLEIGCNGNVKVKTPYLEKELSGFDTVVVALGYRRTPPSARISPPRTLISSR